MLISPDEINKSMSNYGWKYENKKISKSYSFKTYINGIEFVQKIAELAEKNNHHPDIYIGWCKVDISTIKNGSYVSISFFSYIIQTGYKRRP